MVELSVIRDLVAIFGVIAGFSYYVLTVRNNQHNQKLSLKAQQQTLETRQAQLFMHIYSIFQSTEFVSAFSNIVYNVEWKDYDDFISKYGPRANLELSSQRTTVGSYFEGLGVLVKRGLIDATLVDDLLSGLIVMYWEKFKPIVEEHRRRLNYPQYGEWVEYLYNVIKPLTKMQRQEQ